jgi:hypothetical protein
VWGCPRYPGLARAVRPMGVCWFGRAGRLRPAPRPTSPRPTRRATRDEEVGRVARGGNDRLQATEPVRAKRGQLDTEFGGAGVPGVNRPPRRQREHLGLPSVQLTSYSLGLGARRPGTQSLDDKPPAACCAWVPGVRARRFIGVDQASLRLVPGRLNVRNPFVPSDGGHFKGTKGCTGTESLSGRSTRHVSNGPRLACGRSTALPPSGVFVSPTRMATCAVDAVGRTTWLRPLPRRCRPR